MLLIPSEQSLQHPFGTRREPLLNHTYLAQPTYKYGMSGKGLGEGTHRESESPAKIRQTQKLASTRGGGSPRFREYQSYSLAASTRRGTALAHIDLGMRPNIHNKESNIISVHVTAVNYKKTAVK